MPRRRRAQRIKRSNSWSDCREEAQLKSKQPFADERDGGRKVSAGTNHVSTHVNVSIKVTNPPANKPLPKNGQNSPGKKRSQSWTEGHDDNMEEPLRKMTSFEELREMAAGKNLLVGIDLDETVIMTEQSPSWLLTSFGVATFQAFVNRKYSDFSTRNKLCRQLEAALKRKKLVEENIPTIIRELQESGCWVFGLTARYNEMAASTSSTLLKLGVDFSPKSPFLPQAVDPRTGGSCVNGIVYCNGMKKGVVLSQLLHKVSPAFLRSGFLGGGSNNDARCDGAVFIDDSLQQLCSLQKDLMLPGDLDVVIHCRHYQAACLVDSDEDQLPPEKLAVERGKVLLKQMTVFSEQQRVLTNSEARALL
eukprot:g64871.t1